MPKLRAPADQAQNRAIVAKIKYGMEMTGTTVEGLALSMRTSSATVYARLKCPGTFRLQELRAVANKLRIPIESFLIDERPAS